MCTVKHVVCVSVLYRVQYGEVCVRVVCVIMNSGRVIYLLCIAPGCDECVMSVFLHWCFDW